jgi:MFS family permease
MEIAALVASALGPSQIVGRLLCGFMLDKLPPNLVAAFALLIPGVAYAILIMGNVSMVSAYVCAICISFAAGAESDMLAYLVSRYFPQHLYSSTYAILLGFYGMGFGLAPVFAGRVFDVTQSYSPIFAFLVTAAVVGSFLVAALGRPRPGQLERPLH